MSYYEWDHTRPNVTISIDYSSLIKPPRTQSVSAPRLLSSGPSSTYTLAPPWNRQAQTWHRPPSRSESAYAKTKMCMFYLRGGCRHGDACTYAHDMLQLRERPDLSNTRLCPMVRQGHCGSDGCKFAHSRGELRGTNDVYKTGMCRFWSKGRCAAGNTCRHAHGLEELVVMADIDLQLINSDKLPPPPGWI